MQNLTIKIILLVTLILGSLPLLIYYAARLWFQLPSEAQWDKNGGNGSPWGNEVWDAIFIFLPLLLLIFSPIITSAISIALAIRERRAVWLALGAVMCLVQWGFAYWQFTVVYWTIE